MKVVRDTQPVMELVRSEDAPTYYQIALNKGKNIVPFELDGEIAAIAVKTPPTDDVKWVVNIAGTNISDTTIYKTFVDNTNPAESVFLHLFPKDNFIQFKSGDTFQLDNFGEATSVKIYLSKLGEELFKNEAVQTPKKKVSIIMLTLDRFQMTRYSFEHLISFIGEDIEVQLLVLDNGSKDPRCVDYFKAIADVHIAEPENIGIAKGYNKLLRQCTGDYICIIDSDVIAGANWLTDMIYYNDTIEKSGITAIHCEGNKGFFSPLLSCKDDVMVNVWKRKDGTIDGALKLFKREVLDLVGGFDESFGLYGYEDNQFALRLSGVGLHNFYVPNQFSTHIGMDVNETSEYRKGKEIAKQVSQKRYVETLAEMKKTNNFNIPL